MNEIPDYLYKTIAELDKKYAQHGAHVYITEEGDLRLECPDDKPELVLELYNVLKELNMSEGKDPLQGLTMSAE